jgi:Protein of unknown function (DUF4232)
VRIALIADNHGVPELPRRRARRPVALLVAAALGTAGQTATVALASPARALPPDTFDQPTPCRSDQIAVTAAPVQAAVGHRSVTLLFVLAGGAEPCTLTGYPVVDTGDGGQPVHARPTLRGYMGGLPADVEAPPIVSLSLSTQGQAVVEGMAIDRAGTPCPTYTDLIVNPPDTTEVVTVPAAIDACALQVHPITPG